MSLTGLVPLILLVAACGGDTDSADGEAVEAPAVTEAAPDTAAPETTAGEPETTTTAAAAAAEPLGPPAPDFTLELGSGGTFALSEHTQPVLIFFWAEW